MVSSPTPSSPAGAAPDRPPPHVLLICTDQQRSDAVGVARQYDGSDGHPVLQTPSLDWIAAGGARFERAYAESPVCIPARRTLLTGRTPAGHGVPGFADAPLPFPTLAGCLRDAGYQTALAGKLHLWPHRCRYGFEEFHWSDGPGASPEEAGSDYLRHLASLGVLGQQSAHGVAGESSFVRPWHMDERHHVANWTTDRALDVIDRRDPTRPLFLNLSYFHPHPPVTPPAVYLDRYLALAEENPEPFEAAIEADWSRRFDEPSRGAKWNDTRQRLPRRQLIQLRAAYWAQINHLDDQIQRVLERLDRTVGLGSVLILFTSDHGEMLGDHQWMRKRVPWEPSARVPMLLRPPGSWGIHPAGVREQLVGLQDVTPTLLDAAGVEAPAGVEGRSLLPLLGDAPPTWRDTLHGECSDIGGGLDRPTGMQYLVTSPGDAFDRHWKLCWFPGLDRTLLFDLDADPQERNDLLGAARHDEARKKLLDRLVDRLRHRPEGFVRSGGLQRLDGPTPAWIQASDPSDRERR